MKSAAVALLILAEAVAFPAARPGAQSASLKAGELKLIETEYELAKGQQAYFVFRINERALDLRVKGMILKSWEIQRIRIWGKPILLKPLTLQRKTSLAAPQRRMITPGQAEEQSGDPGKFELQALEINDMPGSFSLFLGEDIRISIWDEESGWNARANAVWNALKWSIWFPAKDLCLAAKKRDFTEVGISLKAKKDAQAVYWAFYEGIKGYVSFKGK